ncbi:triose-phosphate isomerase [Candidatus Woesearchaeota archaeon]|nr:triose-phosphate isomerase [Candidatus Woesearchaeota archaeon]
MRKIMIAGNWKMNKTIAESIELVKGIKESGKVQVLVAPVFTALSAVCEARGDRKICVAAQNMHYEESGAFTGEISPLMVKDTGAKHVILGHSERRHIFKEDDALIKEKVLSAIAHGLKVILCIGEQLEEREAEKTNEVLDVQLTEGLKGITPDQMEDVIIAYEPVWAIGTGKVATPEQAQEAHAFCRRKIAELFGEDVAEKVRILYGGSLKPDNADGLLSQKDIDGGLIGGASLKADSFNAIIDAAERL